MPDTTDTQPIRVKGSGDLVAGVPRLLGFVPTDSLVVVMLKQTRVRLTARIDLPGADEDFFARTAAQMTRLGCESTVVLVYDDQHEPSPALVTACDMLRPIDVMHVFTGRWRSLSCADPACCPAEGTPIKDATPLIAALTSRGVPAPLASRSVLREFLTPADPPIQVDPGQPIRPTEALALAKAVGAREPMRMSTAEIRALATAVRHVGSRDLLLTMQEGHPVDMWATVARHSPSAATLTMVAVAAFLNGNGALANIAVDKAFALDPGYALAQLMRLALDNAVPPEQLRAIITALAVSLD